MFAFTFLPHYLYNFATSCSRERVAWKCVDREFRLSQHLQVKLSSKFFIYEKTLTSSVECFHSRAAASVLENLRSRCLRACSAVVHTIWAPSCFLFVVAEAAGTHTVEFLCVTGSSRLGTNSGGTSSLHVAPCFSNKQSSYGTSLLGSLFLGI